MRKLLVTALFIFAVMCFTGASASFAGDCCTPKCKQNTCTKECKPKCDPCKPKCEPCKPKCDPCKPKCEPCKPKCDPCKPKCGPCCKQETCKPKPCCEKPMRCCPASVDGGCEVGPTRGVGVP